MRRFTHLICLAVLATIAIPALLLADEKPASKAKLKGLLVTGGCCHDYKNQTKIITQGMSQRASIEWDVVHEGDGREAKVSIYAKEGWSKGYDVVVHNECYGGVKDAAFVKRIAAGHGDTGIPAVVIHCSMHTYRAAPTDEWRKFVVVTSTHHERAKRGLDVVNAQPGHPIMTGFGKGWKTPNGELYVIENLWPHCKPLATAYSPEEKKDQIVIWTNTYKKARVFGTTLGHHNETMLDEKWLDTVARGLLWATGHLQEDGTPAAGYEGTGRKPLDITATRKPARNNGKQPTPAKKNATKNTKKNKKKKRPAKSVKQ